MQVLQGAQEAVAGQQLAAGGRALGGQRVVAGVEAVIGELLQLPAQGLQAGFVVPQGRLAQLPVELHKKALGSGIQAAWQAGADCAQLALQAVVEIACAACRGLAACDQWQDQQADAQVRCPLFVQLCCSSPWPQKVLLLNLTAFPEKV